MQRKPQPDDDEKLGSQSQVKAAPDENTFSYRSQPMPQIDSNAAPRRYLKGRRSHPLLRDMPYLLRFPPLDPDLKLINDLELAQLFGENETSIEVRTRIQADIDFLERELMPIFRQIDYMARLHQNRARLYPVLYSWIGSLEVLLVIAAALAVISNPALVPTLAFAATIGAAMMAFLATLSGREPPIKLWMSNRARAEQLRIEYFRYLLNLAPFDTLTSYARRALLSERVAQINRSIAPNN